MHALNDCPCGLYFPPSCRKFLWSKTSPNANCFSSPREQSVKRNNARAASATSGCSVTPRTRVVRQPACPFIPVGGQAKDLARLARDLGLRSEQNNRAETSHNRPDRSVRGNACLLPPLLTLCRRRSSHKPGPGRHKRRNPPWPRSPSTESGESERRTFSFTAAL